MCLYLCAVMMLTVYILFAKKVRQQFHTNGIVVSTIPLPVVDESRPWGSECEVCKGKCCGHYKNVMIDIHDPSAIATIALPPSTIVKQQFNSASFLFSDSFVQKAAEKVQLSPSDASIWLDIYKQS